MAYKARSGMQGEERLADRTYPFRIITAVGVGVSRIPPFRRNLKADRDKLSIIIAEEQT